MKIKLAVQYEVENKDLEGTPKSLFSSYFQAIWGHSGMKM